MQHTHVLVAKSWVNGNFQLAQISFVDDFSARLASLQGVPFFLRNSFGAKTYFCRSTDGNSCPGDMVAAVVAEIGAKGVPWALCYYSECRRQQFIRRSNRLSKLSHGNL
jgi:hypothetical protein